MTTPDPLRAVLAKGAPKPGSTGETLTSHLEATLTAAKWLADRIGALDCLPPALAGKFWHIVWWAALTHDCGKVASGFQRMLTPGGPRWRHRHEVLSLGFLPHLIPTADLAWVALPVATHHRALHPNTINGKPALQLLYGQHTPAELADDLGAIPQQTVTTLLQWLRSTAQHHHLPMVGISAMPTASQLAADAHHLLHQLIDTWEDVHHDDGLASVLLQGAVTTADHLSSAKGTLRTHQPFGPGYLPQLNARLTSSGKTLFSHQKQAADVDGHLLVVASTGYGKTETGLSWASRQIAALSMQQNCQPRLFYLLPYLASINAMATRLGNDTGSPEHIGVAHARAASYHLTASLADCDDTDSPTTQWAARKAIARAHATRLFTETVRVGTPYQLLKGALAGPIHSGTLLDAANSVFILDELHAYNPKRLGFILAMAGMWERLGGRIAVLSATFPTALAELLKAALTRPITTIRNHAAPRHVLRTRAEHLTDTASLDEIRAHVRAGQAVLVVANNVRDAITIYDRLHAEVTALWGPGCAHLLHSRFRRHDRSQIERRLLKRWRTNQPHQPGLLVATQCVEVSLDLDFDIAHTSAATLEAMLQRFGRVNRIGARPPADVIIHAPKWTTRKGIDYADGVYDYDAVRPAWTILTQHDGEIVDDERAGQWLDTIYTTPWGIRWRAEVDLHRIRFTDAFLTFTYPFTDRSQLEDDFDEMFDGTEAILAADRDAYAAALATTPGAVGRLTADEYLIPLPWYGQTLSTWDRDLGVRTIHGDYQPTHGLLAIHSKQTNQYHIGEII